MPHEDMKSLLPADLHRYIDELLELAPSAREVWLIGSRANGGATEESDWDFLVFADQSALVALRQKPRLQRDNIDVLVVVDGDRFESPWPRIDMPESHKIGNLKNYENADGIEARTWEWEYIGNGQAKYTGRKFQEQHAVLVFPEGHAA